MMDSFSDDFQTQLTNLMRLRRDVRRFRTAPVGEALVIQCLDAFRLAPSVGLSEPWRIVRILSADARATAQENFRTANDRALSGYGGEKAMQYSRLKLTGMSQAPVQFAIFCDDQTTKGHGLGAQTMPETRRYSVVSAITLMWLTSRALGLGLGWVSILDPGKLARDLDVPAEWSLVAYLCLGWPVDVSTTPELETLNWEKRRADLPVEIR